MTHSMIHEKYRQYRSEAASLLKDLHTLIAQINNAELERIISDVRTTVSEPFLFVVVGEIKAGKSSFVNALLEHDICAVDPAPCTDIIQQIVYGPEQHHTDLSPHLRRISLPVDILKQIAIVDTPGTNTIVNHHQEITERFIPSSGLVLFVFPAKNPHTLTAWELLRYVNDEWRKRVVFILQQADLATEEELRVNRAKVAEYATTYGLANPKIFATSAKREIEGEAASGFDAVRDYIRQTVTGGKHFYLKLQTVLNTAEQVLKQVYDALQALQQQLDHDKAVSQRIAGHLEEGKDRTALNITAFIARLLGHYDRAARKLRMQVKDTLAPLTLFKKAIGAPFARRESVRQWAEQIQQQFEQQLTAGTERIAREAGAQILSAIRELGNQILRELDTVDDPATRAHQKIISWDQTQDELIADIRAKIAGFSAAEALADNPAAHPGEMTSALLQGGLLTVIGIIMLTTHITFIDITGGILTGTGLLLAGGVLIFKKGKILRELDRQLLKGREEFETQLTRRLTEKLDNLHNDLAQSVAPFNTAVNRREAALTPLLETGKTIQTRLIDLTRHLEEAVTG